MEFWGHEIKPWTSVTFEAIDGHVIHLSQVALGETKKGSENVVVFVKVGDEKLAIGTLSADKHPQISCDLHFSETFELSHSSKTTSVFLCGYKAKLSTLFKHPLEEEMETDEVPVENNEREKSAAKVPAKDGKKDKQDEDNETDDSETSTGTDESDDSEIPSGTDESDDSETSSGPDLADDSETSSGSEDDSSDDDEDDMSSGTDDSEDEKTCVKPEVRKKRAVASALKTPASDKKAKISTPKETGDKKSVHVDTPHPAKRASKMPADGKWMEKAPKTTAESKANEKSSKSGSHSCKS